VHASLDTLTLLEVPGRKWKATSAEQGEHVAALFADEPDPFTAGVGSQAVMDVVRHRYDVPVQWRTVTALTGWLSGRHGQAHRSRPPGSA
jgi:hypothetical protein